LSLCIARARKCAEWNESPGNTVALTNNHLVSFMSTVAKFASIAFFGSVFLGSFQAPAYALRMPEEAGTQASRQQAVSAYAGDDQEATATEASVLTPDEVRHIKWCAARYTMKYDAVSDTYAGAGGGRLRCMSPR
jgi:hypothetical protein